MSSPALKPDAVLTSATDDPVLALAHLDDALDGFVKSGLDLALAIEDAQRLKAWTKCEDFMHQLEMGLVEQQGHLVTREHGRGVDYVDHLTTYCRWRGTELNKTHIGQLAAAGKVYRLLQQEMGTAMAVPIPLPENERQLRPMTKALGATYRGNPVKEDELAANLAECWEEALRRADGKLSAAAANFPQVARMSGYKPIANRYTPLTKEIIAVQKDLRLDGDLERHTRWVHGLYHDNRPAALKYLKGITAWINEQEAHRG